jgi:hypothetical protein
MTATQYGRRAWYWQLSISCNSSIESKTFSHSNPCLSLLVSKVSNERSAELEGHLPISGLVQHSDSASHAA